MVACIMTAPLRGSLTVFIALIGAAILFPGTACSVVKEPGSGRTSIAKWKDDKLGAFSLTFDDSNTSQADIAVPALIRRGLVGSWYITPGHPRYFDPSFRACHDDIPNCPPDCTDSRATVWEIDALNSGQELANHTWDHSGWNDCAGANVQIGECARHIRALTGKPDSLMTFSLPGGVPTECTDLGSILDKYHCVEREGTISGGPAAEMIAYAQGAIDGGEWRKVLYHHVDGVTGYLPVSCSDFIDFLDWLVTRKSSIWIATYIDALKYSEERDTADVAVAETTPDSIRLNLTSSKDPVLYDLPLTLITEVPVHWDACRVAQGGQSKVFPIAVKGIARYDAVPNKGEIHLSGD
jgi:peptidoglycan/xylan/chitin deacetylase (PgdA/CDA1 family)